MTKLLVTASGEEHGLVKRVANSVPFDDFKHMEPSAKEKAIKDKKEDSRIVKARYINHRGSHERLDKPYCRWAGDPIDTYHLIPGESYDLPMGFIKEVNDPIKRGKKRSGLLDANERPLPKDEDADPLHELVPISF